MFLEIASNNGTKYIRICESVRVTDPETNKSTPRKKTIKNIGPVSRFDDGKPDFIERLKASYAAGKPILEELRPYLNVKAPQEVYNVKLCEGTDDCIAHPKLIANLVFEKILEDLGVSQLIRSYKSHYDVGFDVYGFFKLLVFGRILNPASKWATVQQAGDYAVPVIKDDIQDYNVYKALDFIYEHRSALFNRIHTAMVKNHHRTTNKIFYDVTNFFFEIENPDEDVELPDGTSVPGLRKKGVCKEERKLPITQMGLLMDEQGVPISIECFPGNTLDHQTLETAFSNSVDDISGKKSCYIYVCDKGIGKGEGIVYGISNGMGYLTSRTVRGASKEEKQWIADPSGYITVNDGFRYKTRIVKKTTTTSDGVKLDYSEKVLTYWSRKYFEREVAEKKSFYDFVQEYQKDPRSFRLSATQVPAIKKYLKKEVLHMKTGELIKTADLAAVLDMDKINLEYNLMGCYSLATSEIHMDDQEIIDTYGNLVEIEEQFHVMKSTLDTRPIYVRTREHIMAHLTICTMALIITRLIQKQLKAKHPELVNDKLLYCNVLSADRIQAALNKLKIEKLGDTYYRFCDIDDPDLALILDSFGISIPKKCFKIGEIRQLKAKMKMSM